MMTLIAVTTLPTPGMREGMLRTREVITEDLLVALLL